MRFCLALRPAPLTPARQAMGGSGKVGRGLAPRPAAWVICFFRPAGWLAVCCLHHAITGIVLPYFLPSCLTRLGIDDDVLMRDEARRQQRHQRQLHAGGVAAGVGHDARLPAAGQQPGGWCPFSKMWGSQQPSWGAAAGGGHGACCAASHQPAGCCCSASNAAPSTTMRRVTRPAQLPASPAPCSLDCVTVQLGQAIHRLLLQLGRLVLAAVPAGWIKAGVQRQCR